MLPLSKLLSLAVTVWGTPSLFTQVTVVPALTVYEAGANFIPDMEMVLAVVVGVGVGFVPYPPPPPPPLLLLQELVIKTAKSNKQAVILKAILFIMPKFQVEMFKPEKMLGFNKKIGGIW